MTHLLELSDILEKVKTTSFKDDESVISGKDVTLHTRVPPWSLNLVTSSDQQWSHASSNKSQTTISSVADNLAKSSELSDKQSSTSRGSIKTSSEQEDTHSCVKSDDDQYVIDIDLATQAPCRTLGDVTCYQSSRSSSSSRHSTAAAPRFTDNRDDVQSVDSLFDKLIEMSTFAENAKHIISSEGLDTLVATMYPESCQGCGAMSLHQIYHPSKRCRKSQSIKAISDVYRYLEERGRKHYKVHKHASFLIKSMECLMDTYLKIRSRGMTSRHTPEQEVLLPNIKPMNTLILLTKLSFEDQYRTVMNDLGVIFAISEFISLCSLFAPIAFSFQDHSQISLNESLKYGCTLLTNLTCGDHHVKSALSNLTILLEILISVLHTNQSSEDIQRVIISLFRNLSWRASTQTKHNLTQVQVCSTLTNVGMKCSDESSVRVLTSCLWNLSAHNNTNKEVICNEGLELLSHIINQPVQRNTTILENTLGVLRNISSHLTQESTHRRIIRELGILPRLVDFLRSNNDTIVSMTTGALWNLSARSHTDQLLLRECGAIPLLRALSFHNDKNISKSATGALRNVVNGSQSRSISPVSNYRNNTPDSQQISQYWLDDYSLISSNDSRSRNSGSPKMQRKVEGRQGTKNKLRFSSTVEKFNC